MVRTALEERYRAERGEPGGTCSPYRQPPVALPVGCQMGFRCGGVCAAAALGYARPRLERPARSAPEDLLMDVFEAIRDRYTADAFGEEVPPRDVIERLIECAVWAPNHFLTEPWTFHVIAGAARKQMGEALVEWLQSSRHPETPDEEELRRASGTATRSPVMIVVGQTADPDGGAVRDLEDYAACCCATQNLMLAAHAEGLVTKWGTGRSLRYQGLKDYLGLAEQDRIVGLVFLGYAAEDAPSDRERRPPKIDWRGI